MKSVVIPTLTVLTAIFVLAGAFIWTELAGGARSSSASAGDGYYITEFNRATR